MLTISSLYLNKDVTAVFVNVTNLGVKYQSVKTYVQMEER
jgi:hypothetical protein